MSLFSGKRFLLLGFIVVLLIAIPLTIYLAQQQQKTKSGATPSTTLTLTPATNTTTVGSSVTLAFNVNPGTNLVSAIVFTITYDPTKIATTEGGFTTSSWNLADGTKFSPSILNPGIIYGDGTIQGTITVGSTPQNAIATNTQIASITFNAVAPTDVSATQVDFDVSNTKVYSVGGESSAPENVLSSHAPASITISGSVTTPTPTVTPTPTMTLSPTPTPTPTITLTPTPTIVQGSNAPPVCNSLTVTASGSAVPLSVNLVANGTDSDGTINKVTFNFGDGTTQDITQAGGIGTNSVSVSTDHVYNTAGTFTATAILTDNGGAQSSSSACNQPVTTAGNSATPTPTPTTTVTSPAPTLPPTGPGQTVLFAGALGAIISAVGVFLLLAL